MATIHEIHDELEALNREREAQIAEARQKALELAQQRNEMYTAAIAKRDAIGQRGYVMVPDEDGVLVRERTTVYDPDLLDAETLAVLEHMGTPVPPIDEVFPNGFTLVGKQ